MTLGKLVEKSSWFDPLVQQTTGRLDEKNNCSKILTIFTFCFYIEFTCLSLGTLS